MTQDNSEKSPPNSEDKSGVLHLLIILGLRLRLVNLLAVACSFIGALCMCFVGLLKTIKAVMVFVTENPIGDKIGDSVTAYVVQAMDAFMIAMVLVVFSTGIFNLFIMELKEKDFQGLRGFQRVSSIYELKKILGQLIIVVLFVHFLKLTFEVDTLEWTILIIPTGALLMATALRLLSLGEDSKASSEKN